MNNENTIENLDTQILVLGRTLEFLLEERKGIIIEENNLWYLIYKYLGNIYMNNITNNKEFETLIKYYDGEILWVDENIIEMANMKKEKILNTYH